MRKPELNSRGELKSLGDAMKKIGFEEYPNPHPIKGRLRRNKAIEAENDY